MKHIKENQEPMSGEKEAPSTAEKHQSNVEIQNFFERASSQKLENGNEHREDADKAGGAD